MSSEDSPEPSGEREFGETLADRLQGIDDRIDEELADLEKPEYAFEPDDGKLNFYDLGAEEEILETAFTVNLAPRERSENSVFVYHDDRDIDLPSGRNNESVSRDCLRNALEQDAVYGPEAAQDYEETLEDILESSEVVGMREEGKLLMYPENLLPEFAAEASVVSNEFYNLDEMR